MALRETLPIYPGDWQALNEYLTLTVNASVNLDAINADRIATMRSATLRPFWAALADVDNTPLDVLAIGDSIGEGTKTTSTTFYPENTYQRRAIRTLRNEFMTTPGGGNGYVPGWYAISPAIAGVGFTWSGAPTLEASFTGLGLRSVKLTAGGQTSTITVTGLTSFDVVYTKAIGGGTFSVVIDGGAATNVSCVGASTLGGQRTNFALGTTGTHTITIAWVSGTLWFEGLMCYNADETKGIRYWDCCHHGFQTGHFSGDVVSGGGDAAQNWLRSIAALTNPGLVIIGTGLNDYSNNVTSAVYKTRLAKLITTLRTKVAAPVPIVLVPKYQRWDASAQTAELTDSYANYVNAARSLAATDPTVWFMDLTQRMQRADNNAFALYDADVIHATSKGQRFIGAELTRQLSQLRGA